MPTTPIAGLTYPLNTQTPDAPAQMSAFLNQIDSLAVPRFTDETQRDARILVPQHGQVCYLLSGRYFMIYRQGAWKKITVPIVRQVPPDSISTPLPQWINTTTRTVVNYLSMPVVAGKNYRISGILFMETPAVDYVDASIQFDTPGAGLFSLATKALISTETQKNGIAIRRQNRVAGTPFAAGVVDKTPLFMDGIYSCQTTGNVTISMAQNTLSAVALQLDAGSFWTFKEF